LQQSYKSQRSNWIQKKNPKYKMHALD
jgi:hypothetical protein